MNNILKLLIPSWRFFDKLGDKVTLYYQLDSKEWQLCLVPPQRHLGNLFLNPKGNLHLLSQTLVEKLAEEVSDDVEKKESFQNVKNLVECHLSELITGGTYRFKITVTPANGEKQFDALTSREFTL